MLCQQIPEMKLSLNTYGKKLHAEFGRLATSVKISEMRRCWTLVSWRGLSAGVQARGSAAADNVPAACRTWSGAADLYY